MTSPGGQAARDRRAGPPADEAHAPPRQRRRPRSGRRAGDSGTRDAILEAARRRFAEHGYDGATIRGIAGDASVDPALVHHFYGSKEELFAAAMRLPVVPSEVIAAALAEGAAGGAGTPGQRMVATVLATWEHPEVHGVFMGMLRSAVTSEPAAAMLREFVTEAILGPVRSIARAADPAEAAYRAGVVASQMLGLAVTRYVLQLPPVAQASPADLAATIGPTLDRYLTGDITGDRTGAPPGGVS
jgi:AcrR family transcriptional regulator